jgi:predicted glycosyltransferase
MTAEEMRVQVNALPTDTPRNFANAASRLLDTATENDKREMRKDILLRAFASFTPDEASEIEDAI